MRKIPIIFMLLLTALAAAAQDSRDVLATLRRANDYFMTKYEDPTRPTFVKKERPSSLWTRAVYYEGLMALYAIDRDPRYADYIDRWADFHQWTPRDGIKTTDADNQCCSQTYLERYRQKGGEEKLLPTRQNLEHQMGVSKRKNEKVKSKNEVEIGWWTWIDAIQMAMPVYAQLSSITGESRYIDHAMHMYSWTRDSLAGGLYHEKDGLWWRDKDFVPPYAEPDGKPCYWSRGNGWVYAALVRVMDELLSHPAKGFEKNRNKHLKLLRKDFKAMSRALLRCQRDDGLWNVSLVSSNYEGKELTGTALFLYGMSWGIRNGLLPERHYREACDRAWTAMERDCVHPNGFLGWVQGTGKEPKDGQPLSYTRIPDFEDFGLGCFLLGGVEYYKLLVGAPVTLAWPASSPEAKAGARWWWMGSAVDEQDLQWNMQEYARAGIGSLEITPIYGVQGNETNELRFLSPEWMQKLQFVEEEGNRNGMLIDMNTGTGWPFGGPLVPIEEAACKAVFVIDTVAVGSAITKTVPDKEKDYAQLLCERRYPLSDGREQVVQLYQSRTRQMVKRAAPGGEGFVIDHFDRTAVSHYLTRFNEAFKTSGTPFPHNFFNDSYEVYGADWTPSLLAEFKQRRGYQLEDHLRELLGLVDDDNKTLADYRETLSDLLLENFTEQWTAWAHSHGAQTRNQAHGSPANLIDVYAAVDVPEIEGFGLTDFGIKGLRNDPGFTRRNDSDISMLKYASSAAHITGKPLTSSETFTWLTEHFRTSLSQMKPDLDLMFTCGVNHMFFHGTTYSPQHDAWPGWKFYASVDMSPTNSIWCDAPFLMKYIERCQTFLQMGTPDNDFLVYVPVRNMWAERPTKDLLMQFDIHSMARKAPDFIRTILQIDSAGYDCDYISERYLLTTRYEAGSLVTAAGTHYRGLIIPAGTILSPRLRAHLDSLKVQGAPIIDGVDLEAMDKVAQPEALRTQLGLRAIRRKNADGFHYFIANLSPNDVDSMVPLAVNCSQATLYNPMNGNIQSADCHNGMVHINLRSGESVILTVQEFKGSKVQEFKSSRVLSPLSLRKRQSRAQGFKSSNNSAFQHFNISTFQHFTLSFPSATPRVDKTFQLNKLDGWEKLDDDSVRVTMGTGVYTTTVTLNKQQARQHWKIDLGDVRESARVYINNVFIGCAWAVPYVLDCGTSLRKGRNDIRIEVTNLPANRIADMDRRGIPWRKFNEINIVDLNYKKTSYAQWTPVPSGLCSPMRLICESEK